MKKEETCISEKPVTTHPINLLKTKHRLLYLKMQYVPHSKHFSSVL